MKAVVMLAIFVTGCAVQQPRVWKKEGGNLSQDKSVCEYEAAKSVKGLHTDSRSLFGQDFEIAMKKSEIYELCMKSKGWTR